MTAYAELQVTSNFSFLRGGSHPEELVLRAAALRLSALALTDRNTLAGVVRAHCAAKEIGLRFVVGARLDLMPEDAPDRSRVLSWPGSTRPSMPQAGDSPDRRLDPRVKPEDDRQIGPRTTIQNAAEGQQRADDDQQWLAPPNGRKDTQRHPGTASVGRLCAVRTCPFGS